MKKEGITRITVNLPSDLVDSLQKTAGEQKVTVTDVIRRGLRTELFLNKETEEGAKILIKRKDDNIMELLRSY